MLIKHPFLLIYNINMLKKYLKFIFFILISVIIT
ncbi:MAG: hypothetical protein RIS53_317, partial [Bacillota bacterium]